jgi:hypothetical protein
MKKILILVACMGAFSSQAQSDRVEKLALDFFNAVKYSDTTAYVDCFINNKDLNHLMYHYVQMQDSVTKDSISKIVMPEMEPALKKEMLALKKQYRDSGVQWNNARYINCFYNILKEKNAVYPSLTGEIIFESEGRQYSIIIGAAVFIDNNWKLATCRLAHNNKTVKERVAYFLEEDNFFGNKKAKQQNSHRPVIKLSMPPKKVVKKG